MKIIVFLIFSISLAACYSRKPPEKTGHEGENMPSFELFSKDSLTTINTKDIHSGQPTVLFYFGPNCPYSRAQMEEIIDNIKMLKNIRFYVFTSWPFAEMKKFNDYYQLEKYSNIFVGVDLTQFFRSYFNVQGVPFVAIYGKDNLLKKCFIGEVHGSQIKEIANTN